jgi:hypothetical protein
VLEDGWVLTQDGGMRVSVRTDMPGVTPAMVDWWFGWHGDAPAKYKLWHPQAHVHAGWRETPPAGTSGRALYVGQTSIVDEYIGSDLIRGAISFVPPANRQKVSNPRSTSICDLQRMLVPQPRSACSMLTRSFKPVAVECSW